MTRAKLCVPAGSPAQTNAGEMLSPSQVKTLGIAPPSAKASILSANIIPYFFGLVDTGVLRNSLTAAAV